MTNLGTVSDQRKITTITFDMDDTLWDFQSAMEKALELTLERLRQIAPGDLSQGLTVQQMMEIRDEVASELGEGATTQEEIRYAAMVRTAEHVGFRARGAAEELHRLYWIARLANARPYEDAPAVLEALRNRYRIGIISNGNNRPADVGLEDIFDFTVFAHECGFPKPDPRIFEFAFAKSGDQPESVVHVGDSLQSDVLGANNHRMLSVWLNRNGVSNETGIVPHWEIGDLNELLDIV